MAIEFHKDPLAVEQSNYLSEIVNIHTFYDSDVWSRNPTNNFTFNNCLFGLTGIVKDNDKGKYVYSGYRFVTF